MTELETLTAQRELVLTRLYGGIRSLQHGDTRKENFSTTEQLRILRHIDDRLAVLNGTIRRRVWYSYQSGKGL